MKTIDFITYVFKCNIFRCLASHEASGSKSLFLHRSDPDPPCLASHEASGSKLPYMGSIPLFSKGLASHEASGSK